MRAAWSRRNLLFSLVRKQYQLRYRQSVGGLLWAILPPIAALGVGALLFQGVMGVETGKTAYSVFSLAALTPWTFFSSSLSLGVTSITASKQMVSRLAFPRAVLPLSAVMVALLDLAVALAVFVVFAYVTGNGIPPTVLWFPLLLAIEIVLVTGVVLLTSALNVFTRDATVAVPFALQFWLFLTPVLYPLEGVPAALRGLYLANPMTGLVESFRAILVSPGRQPDLGLLLPSLVGAAAAFFLGWWYFSATESRFADVI